MIDREILHWIESVMIPDSGECLQLMSSTGMLDNIKKHSLLVARVAVYIGRLLSLYGYPLDVALLEAGGLLHDIGKTESLTTRVNHARRGAEIVAQAGYHELVPIIENHVRLLDEELEEPLDEIKLVNYADKRVLHDKIVTLEHRFEDLRERYGDTNEKKKWISEMEARMKKLEEKIFRELPISPDHVLYLNNHFNSSTLLRS